MNTLCAANTLCLEKLAQRYSRVAGHSSTAFTCGSLHLAGLGHPAPYKLVDIPFCCRVLGSSPGPGSAYGYKQTHRETLQHTLLHDLVVDPLDSYVLTADQGGSMRMWDATSGSVLRSMQPEVGAGEWPGSPATQQSTIF